MAENSKDIWKLLQEFKVEPPVNTFEKVWEIIVRQKLAADNQSLVEKNAIKTSEQEIFSGLQDYSITPPALLIESIKHPEGTGLLKKERKFRPILARAAAVLIVIGAGVFFYFSVNHGKAIDSAVSKIPDQTVPKLPNQTATNPVRDSVFPELTAVPPSLKAKAPKHNKNIGAAVPRQPSKTAAGLTDQVDQLLTLVNYRDPAVKKFFNKVSREKRIVFNEYSYINLSDEMIAMINEVYLKKPNGKPSRKAKRTEKKFKKWKKQDEKYFDRGVKRNPADIIDLSEFLLKN